jgi:hypothetical protein
MHIRFHSSASRHRVSRARSTYVIEHCGLPFDAVGGEGVVLYLGDDWSGIPLEVGAVEEGEDLIVIHAMKLRPKFRDLYEEALLWQK